MKRFIWLVLGLLITGCTLPVEESEDMSGNAQYAKSGGWSNSKKLHNNGTDNMGLSVNFLAGRQDNEIPSKNYTVQFFIGATVKPPSTGNAGGNPIAAIINPVAEITWSVEGNNVRRVVNATNGMSVTGVGQGVKVVVRDQTPPGFNPCLYEVSVSVAPGTRPSENQPATYNPLLATQTGMTSVPPAGFVEVDVPPNAGVISLFATASPSDPAVTLAQNDAQIWMGDAFGNVQRTYSPVSTPGFVPIMPQCTQLFLWNMLPAGPGVPNINYALNFGIDG